MEYLIRRLKVLVPVLLLAFAATAIANANSRFEPIATGSMDRGDAVLELTPELKDNGTLTVKFAANTHTVSLSKYDLKSITVLEVDGRKIAPSDSDRLRGHHTYGKMTFDVGPDVKAFRITVSGLPAEEERVYEWK